MKKQSNFIYLLVTLLFFIISNFYFSNLIFNKLAHGYQLSNAIFSLVYIENTGAAFSIMQNSTTFLIVSSIIALIAAFYYLIKHLETTKMKEIFFWSFLISGIIGNLYERLFFGYVRDFIDLKFINFPVFNISDIFINIGVVGIIILLFIIKKPAKHE